MTKNRRKFLHAVILLVCRLEILVKSGLMSFQVVKMHTELPTLNVSESK